MRLQYSIQYLSLTFFGDEGVFKKCLEMDGDGGRENMKDDLAVRGAENQGYCVQKTSAAGLVMM